MAVRVVAEKELARCRFEIVRGAAACKRVSPDKGTIKQGTGVSPWTGTAISGDYIKNEAQAGRMGHQLYAICVKDSAGFDFREATTEDDLAIENARHELSFRLPVWESQQKIPSESLAEHSNYDRGHRLYGVRSWSEMFSPRQLLSHMVFLEEHQRLAAEIKSHLDPQMSEAVVTYLALNQA